jgi:hypothetical protein
VGPRAGLDTEDRGKVLCPCRGSNPGRPARSQTLYCLSYPAPTTSYYINILCSGTEYNHENHRYLHREPKFDVLNVKQEC